MTSAALAKGTLARYASAGALLTSWLSDYWRRQRSSPRPLSVWLFRQFLADLWRAGYAYASANAARSWVALRFRLAGRAPPTDDWRVRQQLTGYRRWAVDRTHHRSALTADRLALLAAWRPRQVLEEKAFLRTAYAFLLRGGELHRARCCDVRFAGASAALFIRSSKTDQFARVSRSLPRTLPR
jgi:hypothetical protein